MLWTSKKFHFLRLPYNFLLCCVNNDVTDDFMFAVIGETVTFVAPSSVTFLSNGEW